MNVYRQRHLVKQGGRFIAVLPILWLISCGDEDRIVKVGCGSAPNNNISVDMGRSRAGTATIGLLNTRQFAPGTILQLSPAPMGGGPGSGRVVYILQTSQSDYLPPRPETWWNNVTGARFDVEMDADVKQVLRPLNIDWNRRLVDNTAVYTVHTDRKTLRDPLLLIKFDRHAVGVIKNGVGTDRFVVVSAVSYGSSVDLGYSAPSVAVNTVEVSNFYLHLKYECSAVMTINSRARLSQMRVPILFSYVPIKYDNASGTVAIDTNPVDLVTFALAGIG